MVSIKWWWYNTSKSKYREYSEVKCMACKGLIHRWVVPFDLITFQNWPQQACSFTVAPSLAFPAFILYIPPSILRLAYNHISAPMSYLQTINIVLTWSSIAWFSIFFFHDFCFISLVIHLVDYLLAITREYTRSFNYCPLFTQNIYFYFY